ncbi:TetR/AcrR family transcriptional regulator [Fulvivirga lutea]|uniref:TetR/AcrR family transcriptional regulator n=1 Tax=Fulvivirga lutea TaxID=2810512 RepID=A0A974WFD6_9BACT|nr:TetR/AcrR family transcriptional regulator [Fulvivirga lutea]QSE96960.1 TetR/AcrR family transcriptional regulator [Fulvivirga lutea]
MNIEEKIIAGAAELFHKYGIRSVSMDDIARHLSISKKTIYQYYKDKNEIVSLSLKLHMDMNKQEYDEVFKESENALEELSKVSKCMRKDFKDMNPSLLFDLQKYHPKAWEMWTKFKNEYIKNQVQTNLERGVKEGYYRKEINPEALARLRVEEVQLAFDETVYPKDQFNFKELQLLFFDHFVHGIVTPKGKELYDKYLQQALKAEN